MVAPPDEKTDNPDDEIEYPEWMIPGLFSGSRPDITGANAEEILEAEWEPD